MVDVGEGPGAVRFGEVPVPIIAGPCAVESWEQLAAAASAARTAGARLLRGGAFKPRTSPYAFQGLGEEGLRLLARARAATGLPVVTEVMTAGAVAMVAEYADALPIGARNMQNTDLLRACGRAGRPVLLKRGPAATVEELLLAAEYVLEAGNPRVILCERGI
ncbi:MAG TPA: 3-deoxy-7-phosphoheptulonate synthase, partial [Anaeromyxobacter sp.]|nr:3-deoxy-7-phosphoheptulonate synthase [Anaeromyxobacter sp.]